MSVQDSPKKKRGGQPESIAERKHIVTLYRSPRSKEFWDRIFTEKWAYALLRWPKERLIFSEEGITEIQGTLLSDELENVIRQDKMANSRRRQPILWQKIFALGELDIDSLGGTEAQDIRVKGWQRVKLAQRLAEHLRGSEDTDWRPGQVWRIRERISLFTVRAFLTPLLWVLYLLVGGILGALVFASPEGRTIIGTLLGAFGGFSIAALLIFIGGAIAWISSN